MERQQAEFDAFKTEYNILKEEYDGLVAKDDEGTITRAETTRMGELVGLYEADQAKFDAFEEERIRAERDNMQKGWNNSRVALERATAAAVAAKRLYDDQVALNAWNVTEQAAMKAEITKITESLTSITRAADRAPVEANLAGVKEYEISLRIAINEGKKDIIPLEEAMHTTEAARVTAQGTFTTVDATW